MTTAQMGLWPREDGGTGQLVGSLGGGAWLGRASRGPEVRGARGTGGTLQRAWCVPRAGGRAVARCRPPSPGKAGFQALVPWASSALLAIFCSASAVRLPGPFYVGGCAQHRPELSWARGSRGGCPGRGKEPREVCWVTAVYGEPRVTQLPEAESEAGETLGPPLLAAVCISLCPPLWPASHTPRMGQPSGLHASCGENAGQPHQGRPGRRRPAVPGGDGGPGLLHPAESSQARRWAGRRCEGRPSSPALVCWPHPGSLVRIWCRQRARLPPCLCPECWNPSAASRTQRACCLMVRAEAFGLGGTGGAWAPPSASFVLCSRGLMADPWLWD